MIVKTNLRDSYKFYRKDNPNAVDIKTYLQIVALFMQFIMQKVFDGLDVRLPSKLGIIGIRGKKSRAFINDKGEIKGVAPNWGKTKELWKAEASNRGISFEEYVSTVPKSERQLVYCFNEHSDGIIYRLVWYKKNVIIKNKSFYGLTFSRKNRRTSSALFKSGKEYLVSNKNKYNVRETQRS